MFGLFILLVSSGAGKVSNPLALEMLREEAGQEGLVFELGSLPTFIHDAAAGCCH